MTKNSNIGVGEQRRKSSKEALKVVYYVIIGLAIAEALNRAFLEDQFFLGLKIIEQLVEILIIILNLKFGDLAELRYLPPFFLLIAFLCTICRFVHGASIHFDEPSEYRFNPLIDFIGFFLQSSFFYLMALSLTIPIQFLVFFLLMIIFDMAWIILSVIIHSIDRTNTITQWITSDLIIITIMIIFILINFIISYFLSITIPDIGNTSIILVVLSIAAVCDYWQNRDFYFPKKDPFQDKLWYLAHPYTAISDEEIESNVKNANIIVAKLICAGLFIYSPINMIHRIHLEAVEMGLIEKTEWELWMKFDDFMIKNVCAGAIMSPGWKNSKGCRHEYIVFKDLKKPIYLLKDIFQELGIKD